MQILLILVFHEYLSEEHELRFFLILRYNLKKWEDADGQR